MKLCGRRTGGGRPGEYGLGEERAGSESSK